MRYDVLIIGAGVAGLYSAINLPKSKSVLVVCKDIPWECNTFYAQGGVVTALDRDDIKAHIEDTIKVEHFIIEEKTVEILSKTSLRLQRHYRKRYGI